MHPSPSAETCGPFFPNFRCSTFPPVVVSLVRCSEFGERYSLEPRIVKGRTRSPSHSTQAKLTIQARAGAQVTDRLASRCEWAPAVGCRMARPLAHRRTGTSFAAARPQVLVDARLWRHPCYPRDRL